MLFVYPLLTWFGIDKLPKSTVPTNTLRELVNAAGKPQVMKHAIDPLLSDQKTLIIITHILRMIITAYRTLVLTAGGWKVAGR